MGENIFAGLAEMGRGYWWEYPANRLTDTQETFKLMMNTMPRRCTALRDVRFYSSSTDRSVLA